MNLGDVPWTPILAGIAYAALLGRERRLQNKHRKPRRKMQMPRLHFPQIPTMKEPPAWFRMPRRKELDWVLRPIAGMGIAFWLLAHPDVATVLVWAIGIAAIIYWGLSQKSEPEKAPHYDDESTQMIPAIRHVRCPHCKHEQLGPAEQVVHCANQQCSRQFRVPKSGLRVAATCPECGTGQQAEEGAYHYCTNPECGYGAFVDAPRL
jgi:hypothetical protein